MSYLPSFRLDGRVALVTGAGAGLGRHLSLAFAEGGADLFLVGRTRDALEEVSEDAAALGRRTGVYSADLAQTGSAADAVNAALKTFGRIDILINNAGTNVQQSSLEVDPETWDRIMDINLRGAFFMAQQAARAMCEVGKGGRIINIASQMAEVGFYRRATYCASKSGMIGFTRSMAIELAPQGIRVNALGPTFLDSPLAREMFKDPEIADEVQRRIPIGRLGRMEEVAAAAVFLASDGADLITGHHLLTDGGWTAW